MSSSASSSRLDQDEEDELFAELEAEIENDDGSNREQDLKELQHEYINFLYLPYGFAKS